MRSLLQTVVLLAAVVPVSARADDGFYRGRVVDLIIGYPAAGANDLYARAVARHLGNYIPGRPTLVPRNMPGGGSLVAANHVFNAAAKDGTVLGIIAPTMPLEEKLGAPNVRFKAVEFNWIGRLAPTPNVTFVKSSVPVKSIADVMSRETVLSATGRSSTVSVFPMVLNQVAGTRFKLVLGYAGSEEAMLAMERGEAEGHSTTWDGVKARAAKHLQDKTINILVQYGLKRHPELPDVPTSAELGRTPEDVEALRAAANATELGRFILSTPATPADRIAALRRAFDQMVQDAEFAAELKAMRLELGPLNGEYLQKLVAEVANVSAGTVDRLKGIYLVK